MLDGFGDPFRQLDELDAGSIGNDVLVDLADAGVRDAPLDDDGMFAEGETEIVKGIELQREGGFHLHSAMAQLADRSGLKDHYLAVQRSQELDALGIPLVRGHSFGIIA